MVLSSVCGELIQSMQVSEPVHDIPPWNASVNDDGSEFTCSWCN